MKSVLLVIMLLSMNVCYRHKSHKHHKMTPKGAQLSDHYGANPFNNAYGPGIRLVNREAYVKNNDGSVARKRVRLLVGLDDQHNTCDIT